jgi:uroporphyrinogen III methyltransferase/synthase
MMEEKVYIVGSGPGDPGLLTVKAYRLLKECDVLLYDRLVTDEILEIVPKKCEKIYVGKHPGEASATQKRINELLVDRGRKGGIVVRLKGGDPFLFGRGGEEAIILSKAGVPFDIVPGITSAISVPAYAGIPVTQRHISSSVAFITGHEAETKKDSSVDWIGLANSVDTLVVMMGIRNMSNIMKRLMEAGRNPDTPVAVIEKGTIPEQRTITGTIETIHDKTVKIGIKPPAITIIGEVVDLRREISWFEK